MSFSYYGVHFPAWSLASSYCILCTINRGGGGMLCCILLTSQNIHFPETMSFNFLRPGLDSSLRASMRSPAPRLCATSGFVNVNIRAGRSLGSSLAGFRVLNVGFSGLQSILYWFSLQNLKYSWRCEEKDFSTVFGCFLCSSSFCQPKLSLSLQKLHGGHFSLCPEGKLFAHRDGNF